MMAKPDRFPEGYSTGFPPNYESEGSGSSGRIDTDITASEDSNGPRRKCINLNSASRDGFGVPTRVLPLSKLPPSERRDLVVRLRRELEHIRALQKKVELQRTNAAVSSSSDILSCSNTQNGPLTGKVRKSSMLTSGKKLNPMGDKGRGWNRGSSGRFESINQASTSSTSNANLMKQCENLLKKLMKHQYGWVFNAPVDVVKFNASDYFTVIKHPMDLGTIKGKIASSEYNSPLDFLADVRLTFSNAMTYNPPGNDFYLMADTLNKFFEVRWKPIEKKLSVNNMRPLPEKSGLQDDIGTVKLMAPSKRRKLTPIQHEVIHEPVKKIMTEEEKHQLSTELEAILGDLPDNIIEFLKEQSSRAREVGEDEIEIDINDLSDDTLFRLRKLLDDHLQEKQNNPAKGEPCEIELLNESGLSNSSMQLFKGNDPADEVVDICGNEALVSSYPPVEIEKDTGRRSSRCISSGSSGGNLDSDYSSSESESECVKVSTPVNVLKGNSSPGANLDEKMGVGDVVDGNQSVSGLDQLEQNSQHKPNSVESDCHQDGKQEF
ncbi:unnamed protein product [Ilex paraguariensis]|uniref:Transcription factor GTE8 n=1 Tax=Ilex paraguariensis TaxID=185542 RepID=A0ABC8U7N6_9AQUA